MHYNSETGLISLACLSPFAFLFLPITRLCCLCGWQSSAVYKPRVLHPCLCCWTSRPVPQQLLSCTSSCCTDPTSGCRRAIHSFTVYLYQLCVLERQSPSNAGSFMRHLTLSLSVTNLITQKLQALKFGNKHETKLALIFKNIKQASKPISEA